MYQTPYFLTIISTTKPNLCYTEGMAFFLPLMWLLLQTASYQILIALPFAKSFVVAFIMNLLTMYFTGLFGNLRLGLLLSSVVIVVALVKMVLRKTDWRKQISTFFSFSFFLVLLLYSLLFLWHRYQAFSAWDEFMHWGVMIKESLRLNQFYTVGESLLKVHKDYPPLPSLIGVFWNLLSRSYQESHCFHGASVFMSVLFIAGIEEKKKTTQLILVFLFILLQFFPYVEYQTFLKTIYADVLLASLAAFCMSQSTKNLSKFPDYVLLTLSLIALILTKQMAIFFIGLCLMFMLIVTFNNQRCNYLSYAKIFLMFACVFAFLLMWKGYISQFPLQQQFHSKDLSLSSFVEILQGNFQKPWQANTLQNYFNALWNYPLLQNIAFSAYIPLVVLLLIIFSITSKRKTITVALLLGAIGYAFAMLLLYLFSFDSYEAPRLASYPRYLNTYLYFMLLMILYFLDGQKALITLGFSLLALTNIKSFIPPQERDAYYHQENYLQLFHEIEEHTRENDNILLLSQYQDGTVLILNYRYPHHHFEVLSLGKEKYEGDPYSKDFSLEEYQLFLQNYHYLYIYQIENEYIERYWKPSTNELLLTGRLYKLKDREITLLPQASKNYEKE